MLSEPYEFNDKDLEENQNSMEYDMHEYGPGGLCKLEKNEKIKKKYNLDLMIGEGGYSSVWKSTYNNNTYALKISKSNKSDMEIAEKEIGVLKKLTNHPQIVNMHETFTFKKNEEKYICVVLENLGCDLHVLKRLFKYTDYDSSQESSANESSILRCIPINLCKKITYQILQGLDFIHSKNIVHTDLKLDNILIINDLKNIKYNKDINIKICDFGTSHLTTEKCNFNAGTIDYNAPECIIGLPYGQKIDVWAIGCILFEILTGICLFDYTRYYEDNSSSGYSSSSYDNENDKTQIEFLVLCMMKKILKGFPGKVFKKGKYYENYFDFKGRLRFTPTFLDEEDILTVLQEEFNFEEDVAISVNDFILKMLSIDPDKRKNVKELLQDNWFNDKCD